jgi:hypothetical protein
MYISVFRARDVFQILLERRVAEWCDGDGVVWVVGPERTDETERRFAYDEDGEFVNRITRRRTRQETDGRSPFSPRSTALAVAVLLTDSVGTVGVTGAAVGPAVADEQDVQQVGHFVGHERVEFV